MPFERANAQLEERRKAEAEAIAAENFVDDYIDDLADWDPNEAHHPLPFWHRSKGLGWILPESGTGHTAIVFR